MSAADVAPDPFERVLELIEHAKKLPDATARGLAQELVSAVLAVHHDALARIVDLARADGRAEALGSDALIASVLALHELHPVELRVRVERALRTLGPAQGGTAELLSLDEGHAVVRLSVVAGPDRLRAAAEDVLTEAAPDLASVSLEELDGTLVPASRLLARPRAEASP